MRIAGSLTDITRSREDEARLNVALTRFELASEMLNDGIWDLDVVAGDPVNPSNAFWWSTSSAACSASRPSRNFPDVLDSWASRLHPDEKQTVFKAFMDHLMDRSGRTPYSIEYRLRCKATSTAGSARTRPHEARAGRHTAACRRRADQYRRGTQRPSPAGTGTAPASATG